MKKKTLPPKSESVGTAPQPIHDKAPFCSYCLMSLEPGPGGRHIGTLVPYGKCVQAIHAKELELKHSQIPYKEATCTKCGCTDSKACAGGCWWETVDREAGTGVCSNCV